MSWTSVLPSPLASTCPWCNRDSNLERVDELQGRWKVGSEREHGALYRCPGCGGLSLFLARGMLADGRDARLTDRVPFASAVEKEGLPDPVASDRADAWRAFHGGLFKGAALLARSALEVSVRILGAEGSKLRPMIHDLANKGTITQTLATWADEVRATGNEAAHELTGVTGEDADAALYFLDSFLDDVFTVPFMHEERQKAREVRRDQESPETG